MRRVALLLARDWLGAMLIAAGIIVIAWAVRASAHETMGKFTDGLSAHYLWGRRIDSGSPNLINCCTEGAKFDCHIYPRQLVTELDDGAYQLKDGTVVKSEDVSVSPDEHFYVCQHDGQPPHCFHAPKRWSRITPIPRVLRAAAIGVPGEAECFPADEAPARLARIGGTGLRYLGPAAVAAATELYNAEPPESADTFDLAAIADMPNEIRILMLGRQGRFCTGTVIMPDAWPSVQRVLEGRQAFRNAAPGRG